MKLTKYIEVIKHKNKNLRTYFLLAFVRVLLIFIPQVGYIHPDEFFQSVEVMAGDTFDLEHVRTWEFNNTFPIRSVTIPYFVVKVPFIFLKFVASYAHYYFEINLLTSYTLLIYPRLIMCLVSFINDWSLYKICDSYGLNYEVRLMALGSSFILLVFGTRTFSNTIEMAISSLLLYYVADCMIHSNTVIYKTEFLIDKYNKAVTTREKVQYYKMKGALPSHSFNRVFIMSTLCVVGVFNRPTFLIFGAPMVFYWLLRGMGTKTIKFLDFNLRIASFCLCALPSILLLTLIDSLYYLYLTAEEIHNKEIGIDNFVFTPWNFVKYNIDPSKTASHGVHPRYLHLLVNFPLLYNVLGITAVCSFAKLIYRFIKADFLNLPRSQSIMGLMTSAIFAPLTILSLINHQEPRFLLPLTLPVIFLHSPMFLTGICTSYPFKSSNRVLRFLYDKILCTKISSKYSLKLWYIVNIFLVMFFGFVHQGGVWPLAQHFSRAMSTHQENTRIHLITSHTYNIPLTFINIPSTKTLFVNRQTYQKYTRSKQFFLYEYGSIDLEALDSKVKLLVDVCEDRAVKERRKYQLFLTMPSSLSDRFAEVVHSNSHTYLQYKQVKIFYPHLSTEAPPDLFGKHLCDLQSNGEDASQVCNAFDNIFSFQFLSTAYLLKQFSSIVHQFGLVLYEINVRKPN